MAIEQKKNNQGMDAEEMLSRSETFIEKNKKSIIGVIIVIVLIIVGIVLYKNHYKAPREEAAAAALFAGENYFNAGEYDKALNGDSVSYYGFAKVIKDYSGTKAANLAKAYAGLSLAKTGKYQEALSYLEDFSGNDDHIAAAVMAAAGNCYANLDNLDKAVSLLVKAADKSNSQSLSPVWLKQAGEIYEKMGKPEEALKCYTKIKEKYNANSMIAGDIDKYIEKVSK